MKKEVRICICGCKEKFECSNNSKRRYISGHWLKGKTYEELYGTEKSQGMKEKVSKLTKGKTYEEMIGIVRTQNRKKKLSDRLKGKNLEEIHGNKVAQKMKEKISITTTGIKRGTLEERFGIKKAKKIRHKLSISNKRTYEEIYGKDRAQEKRIEMSKVAKGQKKGTFEERYGKEKAQKVKEKLSKSSIKWTTEKIINAYLMIGDMKRSDWDKYRKLKLLPHSTTIRKRFGSFEKLEEATGKKFLLNTRVGHLGGNEKQILDVIEKEKGIKLKRQHNVKKYSIDGYDSINNVAYEVDELYHNSSVQKIQDHIRENKIKNIIGCTFIRLREEEFLIDSKQKTLEEA